MTDKVKNFWNDSSFLIWVITVIFFCGVTYAVISGKPDEPKVRQIVKDEIRVHKEISDETLYLQLEIIRLKISDLDKKIDDLKKQIKEK